MTAANMVAMACAVAAPVLAFYTHWGYVAGALVIWQLFNVLGISVGAHRYFSHGSFECNRFWEWVMAHLCMVSLVGPPCIWAEAHVQHHRFSDRANDPYKRFALDGDSALNHTTEVGGRFLRRVAKSQLHRLTLRYYWAFVIAHMLAVAGLGSLFGLNPLASLFWLYVVPAGLSQLTLRFVLWTGHVTWLGYRTYDIPDTSNNWWIASLVAAGEGWHNNHHAHPAEPRLGQKWWELDIGWWVVKAIRK